MSTPPIYGLATVTGSTTYAGATGALPGASTMGALALVNFTVPNNPVAIWQNLASGDGWSISYTFTGTPGTVNVTVTVDGTTTTVQIGAVLDEWVLLAFTLNGTALVIYVNGQVAGTATLGGAVTPSGGQPTLALNAGRSVALVAYTEQTLSAANIAAIFFALKNLGGVLSDTLLALLDHVYVAATSQRLPALVFEDTGDVGGVDLVTTALPQGFVFPGDFGQLAGVIGPTGPTGP